MAAAGAAVAFYFYSRRVKVCGFGGRRDDIEPESASSHFEGAYQAPSTWMEALLFFAEALRYFHPNFFHRLAVLLTVEAYELLR